jgi:hypothetical protein
MRSKVVKICLRGECKDIQIVATNGQPARSMMRIELDHNIPLEYHRYDIQLFFPTEFASLIEVGATVGITLEQIER